VLTHRVHSESVSPEATARAPNSAPRREPKKPVVEFNMGTAAYRAGQFPQAAQSFEQSITHAPSSDLKRLADQEDAYYNLGNSLYRTGQKTEQTAPQETLQKWTEAVKAYETALQLRADDADSRYNRDLVKRKIDALKQKQNGGSGGSGGKPPPSPPQNSNNNDQKRDPKQPPPGQPPQPPNGGGSTGVPPSQTAGQPPPAKPAGEPPHQDNSDARAADSQRLPGQMSREEARELLDSAKGEERHALGAPLATRDAADPPDKPFKNW
jgi:Ca-activated chloride channel homolog